MLLPACCITPVQPHEAPAAAEHCTIQLTVPLPLRCRLLAPAAAVLSMLPAIHLNHDCMAL